MADPDLQISGRGGGHPDPEIRGGLGPSPGSAPARIFSFESPVKMTLKIIFLNMFEINTQSALRKKYKVEA